MRAGRGRQVGHAPRVPNRVRRLEVDEVGDRLEDILELLVRDHRRERRFGRDHGVPVASPRRGRRTGPAPAAQKSSTSAGSNSLPLRVPRGRDGRLDAVGAVEDLDHVGEVDQPRREQDLLALEPERGVLAVPALEGLLAGWRARRRRDRAAPPARRWPGSGSPACSRPRGAPPRGRPRRAGCAPAATCPTRGGRRSSRGRRRLMAKPSALSAMSSPNHLACS